MDSQSDPSSENLLCHSEISRNIINQQFNKLEKCDLYERPHKILLHLAALEHERIKLDAFKRELPFCMQLLHEAIQASKEQLALSCQQLQDAVVFNFENKDLGAKSVLKEPNSQRNSTGSSSSDSSEVLHVEKIVKSDVNTEIKVWNPRAEVNSYSQQRCQSAILSEDKMSQATPEAFNSFSKPTFLSREKTGGAFMPFSQRTRPVQPVPRPGALNPADLELVCPASETIPTPIPRRIVPDNSDAIKSKENIQPHVMVSTKSKENTQPRLQPSIVKENRVPLDVSNTNFPIRKARRSWSPELHRLFLNALQKLGGSQATPKQIREAMNVEGLTNDEIKSHLQKYRLHTRRLETPVTLPLSPQVLIVGGVWGPSEQIHQAPAAVDSSDEVSTHESKKQFKSSMCAVEQLPSSWQGPLHPKTEMMNACPDPGRKESLHDTMKCMDTDNRQ